MLTRNKAAKPKVVEAAPVADPLANMPDTDKTELK